jgi:hypothetical protein
MPATGVAGVEAVTPKPAGGRTTASVWLIQQVPMSPTSCSRTPPSAVSSVFPNSAVPVRATSPPSAWAMACMP